MKKVPRLGDKAYEQCAGFLRIVVSENPLDASAVHPEAYAIVAAIAKDANILIPALIGNNEVIKAVDVKKYISETFGEHTIKDILNELKKPGLDPRKEIEQFSFANIYKIPKKVIVTKKSTKKSECEHYALSDECIVFFKSLPPVFKKGHL